ncbi:hypothetical protein McanMca71_004853 [Microsporum canis]|uniref:CHCH domain-containing protein n=1 Tax=Arthroderma otae (strain ATCC MYA-4605 / CBS 113480) TaxID=554155 RepID=C5FZH2_ARTOC|nr:CHCH domain-containing protein [Microsporum canis CBS 113480]EEQ35275.1 CHCH domain-containing protein [Microsporum canis CBS 113480]
MARQRRSAAPARSAPTRPTAAPARPAAPQMQQQQRPSSTAAAAHPQTQQAPVAQSSGGSSLFGQMAATAGGVAIGSSIGHAVGSFFTGGSSSAAPAETQQAAAQPMDSSMYQSNSTSGWAEDAPCAADARSFRKCMDDNRGDLSICGWYMDQLKACQQAAKPY